jgi:hypothetical protein
MVYGVSHTTAKQNKFDVRKEPRWKQVCSRMSKSVKRNSRHPKGERSLTHSVTPIVLCVPQITHFAARPHRRSLVTAHSNCEEIPRDEARIPAAVIASYPRSTPQAHSLSHLIYPSHSSPVSLTTITIFQLHVSAPHCAECVLEAVDICEGMLPC